MRSGFERWSRKQESPFRALYTTWGGGTRFVGGFDQGEGVDTVLDSKHWYVCVCVLERKWAGPI